MVANAGRTPQAAPTSYGDLNTRDVATDVYTAFRNSGFSDAQAQALTAEINRENNMQQKYLFGNHPDDYNKKLNVGMLSWQKDRAPAVMDFLTKRGVVGEDGAITPGFDALQAQTDFIRQEMETNPLMLRHVRSSLLTLMLTRTPRLVFLATITFVGGARTLSMQGQAMSGSMRATSF